MPRTYSQILLHIVFTTKHRQPFIRADVRERLHAFLGGIVKDEKGVPLVIGGMPDHVHLLVRWRTDETIANLMRNVKARSSAWVHSTFPGLEVFDWQDGYGVFSVSASGKDEVVAYIQNQEEHHQKRSFEEEFLALLRLYQVEFDEAYVFDRK